ncbi:FliH/SctL family protein [Desulfotomaculum nigrificans]|uniref:FliH/SctL family protein n=1 Tax=Desulfotomaculum nigrificans TaxID=1565 RepID=UPI0001FAE6EC|nr:FliH/SctL family protein [Desulfotomaculum nigrificans]
MFKVIKSAPVEKSDHILPLRQLPVKAVGEGEASLSPEELLHQAKRQAADILNQARAQAAEILQQARSEAELQARQIKEQAKESGWQEGIHAAETEAEKIREQARQVLGQAREVYRQTLEQMESDIVDLAVDIAERVVMAQLAVEPQTIMQIAQEALELVKNRPVVTIYVSEADLAIIESNRARLLHGLPGKVELNILVDNMVQPGGCRVETDQGQVDATLETRWQETIKALYGQEE